MESETTYRVYFNLGQFSVYTLLTVHLMILACLYNMISMKTDFVGRGRLICNGQTWVNRVRLSRLNV